MAKQELTELMKEKILHWEDIKSELDRLKKLEMEMRVQIVEELINGAPGKPLMVAETKKFEFNNGDFEAVVTASSKTTLKLDYEAFQDLVADGEVEDDGTVVKYTPTLSKTELNKKEKDDPIFEAIFEKPAAPSLALKILD